MRILLFALRSNPYFFSPPLGLGYIAAYLLREGHEVKIMDDFFYKTIDKEVFKKSIIDFNPSIIGFASFTYTIKELYVLAAEVKKIKGNIKVVLGGPHASHVPEDTIANMFVDIVVRGEGEETMVELANALENKISLRGIKGILYKDMDGNVIDNGPREFIKDLDAMPFPAFELLDMRKYFPSVLFKTSNRRFGAIITSRGCHYECTFCAKMLGKTTRLRSPESVVTELEMLVREYGIGEFLFVDDTFTLEEERALKICDLIISRKLNIVWSCHTRADHASEKMFLAMEKAGCKCVFFGMESASQEVLELAKKGITVKQSEMAASLAHKYIGNFVCSFIFGLPGDTIERANNTIEFAKKINPDFVYFQIATPMPGSEIFNEFVRGDQINMRRESWDGFLPTFPMASPAPALAMSEITKEELALLAKRAFREFYFRPKYVFSRFFKLRAFRDLLQYLQGILLILKLP